MIMKTTGNIYFATTSPSLQNVACIFHFQKVSLESVLRTLKSILKAVAEKQARSL